MSEAARWDQEYRDGRWDFLHRLREAPRYGIVLSYLMQAQGGKPASLLDIGCGDGALIPYLAGLPLTRYVGVDISAEALAKFQGLPAGGNLVCADLAGFQPDGQFDAILFNEVLFFTDDPAAELRRYRRALAPGGVMVVSMYEKASGGAARCLAQVAEELSSPGWTLMDSCRLTTLGKGTNWRLFLAQ